MQKELTNIWLKSKKTVFFITHDVEEAILLCDRLGIMKAGPESNMKETFRISMVRPRDRMEANFLEYYDRCRHLISQEAEKALMRYERL